MLLTALYDALTRPVLQQKWQKLSERYLMKNYLIQLKDEILGVRLICFMDILLRVKASRQRCNTVKYVSLIPCAGFYFGLMLCFILGTKLKEYLCHFKV